MDIAKLRDGVVQSLGSDITVHKNLGSSNATQTVVKGTPKFQQNIFFLSKTNNADVARGDVLQVAGCRDFWRVESTQDQIHRVQVKVVQISADEEVISQSDL